jgi:hypothetical protein
MVAGLGESRKDMVEIPLDEPSEPDATLSASTIVNAGGAASADGRMLWSYAGVEMHRTLGKDGLAVLRLQALEGDFDMVMTDTDAAALGEWLMKAADGR